MRASRLGKSYWVKWGVAIILMIGCDRVFGAEQSSQFEQANRLYEQGKFVEASNRYENMIKEGQSSVGLFFNLGNAYFKAGSLGKALSSYRAAEALAPRDPDIQANLRFARDRVSGSISTVPPPWQRAVLYFTSNELTVFCSLLFWVWAGLFCVARIRPVKSPGLRLAMVVSASLFVAALLTLIVGNSVRGKPVGIVIVKQASVHLGPLAESQVAYSASEGTELRVTDQRTDWSQVADRTGRNGWIASTNILIFRGKIAPWTSRATNNFL